MRVGGEGEVCEAIVNSIKCNAFYIMHFTICNQLKGPPN